MFLDHIGHGGLVGIVLLWSGASPQYIVAFGRAFGWSEFGRSG